MHNVDNACAQVASARIVPVLKPLMLTVEVATL
jgi:hypothetical protein